MRPFRIPMLVAVVTALSLLASGCVLGKESSKSAEPGSLAKKAKLDDVTVTVGSKEFTEQKILCEITAQALESTGATVKRKCGLSGSDTTRTALTSGTIDMYWEYTGTAWISYQKHTKPIPDADEQFKAVAKEDKAKNKIVWLDKAPFNNSYGIAVAKETAKKKGINSLSDYAKLAKSDPKAATICTNGEFRTRDDGLPGVQKKYGFELPSSSVKTLAEGAIYDAMDKGNPCDFGMVATTDGRIPGLGLKVLQDDKKFFPLYNPAVNVRQQVLDKNPDIAKALNPLSKALDTKTMQNMNADVDIKGKQPEDVAETWLQKEGFVGKKK